MREKGDYSMSKPERLIIKCTRQEYEREFKRLQPIFDSESRWCEIPNSRPNSGLGGKYKPHPQFTITILGRKITVWTDANQT
jgi:hypothetical protein